MKSIPIAALLGLAMLVAGPAHSQTAPGAAAPGQAGAGFAGHKAKLLANIDQRASAMAALRSCVAGAADHPAVKACEQQHRASVAALSPR